MSGELLKHTEAAMALLGGQLPKIVYLPPDVRQRATRVTAKGVVTDKPLSLDEQLDRIVRHDPLGFLLAMMNGQPVVAFSVETEKQQQNKKRIPARAKKQFPRVALGEVDGATIYAEYHVPSIADRERIAMYLTHFIVAKAVAKRDTGKDGRFKSKATDEFDDILAKRAAGISEAGDAETE